MSVRDEIMKFTTEGYGHESGSEWPDGFNCGLDWAADIAVEYVSKLTDQRNHFERLVTYLRVRIKDITLVEMMDRGGRNDIDRAEGALRVVGDELESAWDALTDDEKREMDALINWEPT